MSMTASSRLVDDCVESLCQCGCGSVKETICRIESGDEVSETANLSPKERSAVLEELKSIMAIYSHRPCKN